MPAREQLAHQMPTLFPCRARHEHVQLAGHLLLPFITCCSFFEQALGEHDLDHLWDGLETRPSPLKLARQRHPAYRLSSGKSDAFQAGAMKSVATSGLIDGQAVSQAESFVSNVSVAGVLQIQQVHSTMEVISDGAKATVTKSQLIGGLTVGGQSITFDSTGFHAGGQSQDPFGKFAKSLIDQYLTPNGISISVAPPVVTKNAGTGSINGSSLVITLNAQGMEKIVKNIPEPYRTWLQSPGSSPLAPVLQQFSTFVQGLIATPTQFDQTIEIRLGDLSIASAAAPAYIAPPLVTPLTPPGGPVAAGPLPGPQILPGSSTNNTIGGVQQGGSLGIVPVAAKAVPIVLVFLALLWMLAGATGLDRMATAATSSVAAEQCPLEKP